MTSCVRSGMNCARMVPHLHHVLVSCGLALLWWSLTHLLQALAFSQQGNGVEKVFPGQCSPNHTQLIHGHTSEVQLSYLSALSSTRTFSFSLRATQNTLHFKKLCQKMLNNLAHVQQLQNGTNFVLQLKWYILHTLQRHPQIYRDITCTTQNWLCNGLTGKRI